ncbi:hypothetical protein [Actinoplanes missouriensis]|nr:hypothetical protein [Actinoplanes missouriensis]
MLISAGLEVSEAQVGLCAVTMVVVRGGAFNAVPVLLGSASLRVALTRRDAALAVYVVAFRGTFPARISLEEHHRAEQEAIAGG